MGGCFSILITPDMNDNKLSAASTANIITITGEFRQFVTPISVSLVLEQIESSASESFICNSDNLYYDENIPALKSDEELRSGEIYFVLPNSKLQYPLTASEMAALAIKASAALSSNKTRRSRISPVLSIQVDEKVNENSVSDGIVRIKKKGGSDKQHDIGISRSGSIRKLQRYSSQRVKLAARSFRLKLNTIYEGSVLLF
ncbi:putative Poly polymerase 1 [Heracleum sosnowskyi]|uniref:Poly polymerase 1 n=1 Tax=Heracleum sosnowskyi TaxID=360622 RepID=A0AAD8M7P0_9APIA|nr:putative Poly polymerase 1 [Heracleum sosnowskyi]